MATAPAVRRRPSELHSGDRMTQKQFHRIYARMPNGFKAELVGGIVYVASPLKLDHGTTHPPLNTVLFTYQGHTPGVQCGDNATIILGDEGEPQPDNFLRILPEYGGRTRTTRKGYVRGGPEFLAEIAHSSQAIDLHAKRSDYARFGVLEYLVVCLGEQELRWFDLRSDKELHPGPDHVFRIRAFPGLWIHGPALLAQDYHPLMNALQKGLATPEHAAFVTRLAAVKAERKKEGKRKRR